VDALANTFDPHQSLRQWYGRAAQYIEAEERRFGAPASQPQFWVGKNMEAYASQELGKLSSVVATSVPKAKEVTMGAGAR